MTADDDDDDDDDYTWRALEIYWTWHGYQTYQHIQDNTLHIILQEKYCIHMSTSFSDQYGLIFQLLDWTVMVSSTRISPEVPFLPTEQHTINFAEQSDISTTLYGLSWLRTSCSVYLWTHWDGNRLTSLLYFTFVFPCIVVKVK